MVRLKNASIKEILHRKEDLVIYGASQNLGNMLTFLSDAQVADRIRFVVDRDEEKDGREFVVSGFKFPMISLRHFLTMKDIPIHYQMLIVIEQYLDVIRYLDKIPILNGMLCYVWWVPFLSVHSQRTLTEKMIFLPVEHQYEIPRVIHYCWFGGKEHPQSVRKCIDSWKRLCPNFVIQEWNEGNYDVKAIPYTREAYERRKFSFVSDYARYDIISRYGGFYFDTDVELLKDINDLCQYRGFFSFEYNNLINSGSGFAAQQDDEIILELKNAYHNRTFVSENQELNLKPCSEYETEYFEKKGVMIDDSFQMYQDFLIFPHEVFAPVNQVSAALELTQNTRGIHRFDCAWLEKEVQMNWKGKKISMARLNERLMKEWEESSRRQ